MRGPRWRATSSSTSRSCREPGGSSTTRSRSGSGRPPSCRPRSARRASTPATSPRSASPTSARPPSSGTAAPAGRCTTRSSGRTPAPTRSRRRSTGTGAATRSGTAPDCPPATYFAGGKLQWILEQVDGVREAAERGDALFGTADTWLLWHLTGGPDGGVHITDVTNASRTMLMDLETLDWDDELLGFFGVPRAMLPQIRESSASASPGSGGPFGVTRTNGPFGGEVPLTGILGDQQAATVGQVCFEPGEAKNTYGTGNFMLLNTGTEIVRSEGRAAHDAGLPVRRRAVRLRAGGLDRRHRLRGPVAARPARHHQRRGRVRVAGPAGRRQRRGLLRAGVLRPVRAVLALGRARRHRRALPLQHQRPPGPGDARSDLLPVPRRRRGDVPGLGRAARGAQGRRRA